MPLSKRVNRISESPTMKIASETKELLLRGEDIIDLTAGEPNFDTPQNIKDAAIKAIMNNQTRYTNNQGTIELREAIAFKLKRDNNLTYTSNQIIVSNGAKQCIYNAIQALVNIDDEVIFSAPYYVSYPQMVTIAQGKNVIIETTEETGFKILPNQLANAITEKTKLLILCNPCNPTGTVYTKEELKDLTDVIGDKEIYILADEIYEKLIYDGFNFCSVASISEKVKEKTVTINGHSKAYAMTGWRLGYAAGPQNIISAMNKYQSHSTSNACSISQAAALEALLGQQETVEFARADYEMRRNYLYEGLLSIKGISCYKPHGAFYLFPNVSYFFNRNASIFNINNSFDLSMYLLQKAKVATVPGSAFGLEGFLRITYAPAYHKIEEAVTRIKKALGEFD